MTKWTEQELNTFDIILRINAKAQTMAEKMILEHEGYKLPKYRNKWTQKHRNDYNHYSNLIKQDIINNKYLCINEQIKRNHKRLKQGRDKVIKRIIGYNI